MAKRRRSPSPNPANLPGPDDIHRRELSNGIVVLARENRSSPSVVLAGSLRANGLSEDGPRAGLADLAASGLMRGTERRSFQEIYESIEAIGASLGVSGGKVGTSLHGKSLAEDLRPLLELLDEVLRRPTFPEGSIAQLRHEKLTGLTIRDDDTGARADLAFDEIAYPSHPYAIPGEGSRDSVSRLTAQDLVAFHRSHYGPRGMILCIVGAVDPEAAVDLVRETLGSWQAGNSALECAVRVVREACLLPHRLPDPTHQPEPAQDMVPHRRREIVGVESAGPGGPHNEVRLHLS